MGPTPVRDSRAVAIGRNDPAMNQHHPRLVSANFRLASHELNLDVEIRLRQLGDRWLAVAELGDDPEVGIGATARVALAASLATLGERAATALMADPRLLGVSAEIRRPA